ncbi:MAG: sigma-70 family RNA polymerase sigma factor [Gaiellaceae bacterium]
MTPILARQRPERAFERLYRKHAGDVYRYALVVLRNQADAEDVTQTTFLNAYRAFERGERPRSPQNWLIAIAHNVCRQRFRQAQRRPNEVELNEDLTESVFEEGSISAEDIRRALGHLAFNQRSALVMRELEGRSYQEIAQILGLSVSAVETLIFRARRALREQLEEGITCHEAELAISRQLDGRLSRKERGILRAHLRECEECSHFARSQRAQRGAIKSLAAIPLPQSLASLFGGGGAAGGGTVLAVKAAALGASAMVATGVGYEGVKHVWHGPKRAAAAQAAAKKPVLRTTATSFAPQAAKSDLKPFRHASIRARRAHDGRPAVLKKDHPLKPVQHEVSVLPPSRARTHDLKPLKPAKKAKPVRPAKPAHPSRGKAHVPKTPKPPKQQPPASPHPKGKGGRSTGPTQTVPSPAVGHGKSNP